MSFKIEQGLFSLDFTDYYAILGIPVDADAKALRKRYLNLARRLHPDSFITENAADRQLAAELLSKLVNPAYETLSREKPCGEYAALLRLKGQQALRQQATLQLTTTAARGLAAASDLAAAYYAALQAFTDTQYQQLEQSLDCIGQLSELNLVYLMRKQAGGEVLTLSRSAQNVGGPVEEANRLGTVAFSQRLPAPATREALISAFFRRAQEFESNQNFARAIQELREALRMEPTNSNCHSRLGLIYLKTQQTTMAKIHFNKALELNPQDAVALEGKQKLEPPNGRASRSDAKAGKSTAGDNLKAKDPNRLSGPGPNPSGGGLLGLFGNKKK
jgi:curved DNA-binding protein CbpA